tara:strand:+ start:51 stop:692 length:642 start_codon:yes stop_codon:yes gene_type:complete
MIINYKNHPFLQIRKKIKKPFLFFMTDIKRTMDLFETIKTLPKGCILIFRHYEHKDRHKLAKCVVTACRQAQIFCLISNDIHLATRLNANGVHFPEYALHKINKRPRTKKHMVLTAAAHSFATTLKAQKLGFDAVLLSPVYNSESHPNEPTMGHRKLASICSLTKIPIIALGGINTKNITQLINAGVTGFAGIGIFSKLKKQSDARNYRNIGI